MLDTNGSFSVGEIRLQIVGADLLVSFNQDADAAAEMTLLVQGVGGPASSDFLF